MPYTDIHLPLPGFIALDWTLMTVALIPILLRFSLRRRHIGPHLLSTNISDGFVLLAWLSGIVLISINTWKNSLRSHYAHTSPSLLYYMVPRPQAGHLLYVSWISLFFIYISLWSSKAALIAFYYSIFSLQGRRTRLILYAASLFTLATFILHMCLIAFWCSPIASNWSIVPPGTPGQKSLCSAVHSIRAVTLSTFTNIATDLVILSIPLTMLFRMRLSRPELSGLFFVFLMGSISILAALVRFVTLKLVEHVPRAEITHTIDVWALVEIVSSLMAVCLPSLRTFVRRHRGGSEKFSGAASEKESEGSSRSGSSAAMRSSAGRSVQSADGLKRTATETAEERDVEEEAAWNEASVGVARPAEARRGRWGDGPAEEPEDVKERRLGTLG